jgi:hypothetical protein
MVDTVHCLKHTLFDTHNNILGNGPTPAFKWLVVIILTDFFISRVVATVGIEPGTFWVLASTQTTHKTISRKAILNAKPRLRTEILISCRLVRPVVWEDAYEVSTESGGITLLFVVYLTTLFQYLRLYSVDFYSILIRLPSSSETGGTRVRNCRWILPTSTYRTRRVILHAVNLRHGTDGPTTSPPKEGVLRILSPLKSIVLARVWTREPWVQWQTREPLHHRGR